MKFTGDVLNAQCPITHVAVCDLSHPVGFDSNTAYECDALVAWLKKGSSCNPLTMEPLYGKIVDIVRPLIINCNDDITETYIILNQAGVTKVR